MSDVKVAKRYAKSVIDLAGEMNILDHMQLDVNTVATVFKENASLVNVLQNPIVSAAKKIQILEDVFSSMRDSLLFRFFKTVVKRDRAAVLPAIVEEIVRQFDNLRGIIPAHVKSALPLNEQTQNEIIALITQQTGAKTVKLVAEVDPDIIGGFVINVGDKQIDASIKTKLNRLKQDLVLN